MDDARPTRYSPELYYFLDSTEFGEKNFKKSVFVTAKTVSRWSDYYSAKLLSPREGVKDTKKGGKLPVNKKERDILIQNTVEWIFENSCVPDLFALFLGDEAVLTSSRISSKFDHHDDTCCWVLNLTEKEFRQLKRDLKENGLPEDLFYESSKGKRIAVEPKTFIGKLPGLLGIQTFECTPKRREMKESR